MEETLIGNSGAIDILPQIGRDATTQLAFPA
jgi:hypothetical protein